VPSLNKLLVYLTIS